MGGRRQESEDCSSQYILEHFAELRRRLTISALAVFRAFGAIFFTCSGKLTELLTEPVKARGTAVIYTALADSITVQAKVSLIAAVVAASPVVLFQLWQFIRPALYPSERKLFTRLFGAAVCLFLTGVAFAYEVVFHMAVNFFLVTGENMATPMIDLDTYVGFLGSFLLPFGLVFELPVAMILMTRMGLVDHRRLKRYRKYVLFAIFALAAVLTPPDIISQVMLGLPLAALYECGIIISMISGRRKDIRQKKNKEECYEGKDYQETVS